MKFKKINKLLYIFFSFSFFIILVSCKDLFLRFKYQTNECEKNSFNLKKISIKKDSIGSFADVQFGDIYYKIKIFENNNDLLVLKNKELDLEIEIHKNTEKVDVISKNIIKKLNCTKTTFRM